MLPNAITGVLGVVGVTGSDALARTLSPVAEPLFIGSGALILIGALVCSRLVVLLAAAGTTLLYLSMFQLASGATRGGGSMSMMSTQHRASSSLHADVTTFYVGLIVLVAALVLAAWRRNRRACNPVIALPRMVVLRH